MAGQRWRFEVRHGERWGPCGSGEVGTKNLLSHLAVNWTISEITENPLTIVVTPRYWIVEWGKTTYYPERRFTLLE